MESALRNTFTADSCFTNQQESTGSNLLDIFLTKDVFIKKRFSIN